VKRPLKTIILFVSILILLLFILFVINQTAQVLQLADRVSPSFGHFVFWALLICYALLLSIPIFLFLRLPKSLTPPKNEEDPKFDVYLSSLRKRLDSNPHLTGLPLSSRQQIEEALALLSKKSNEIIEQMASTVFISTAISQSGRLDAFLVLSAQSRMVWRIARLYYQRPTLRDLIHLYANIAGTAFLASELDDIDISEQVEPVLSSALGALAVSIPGIQIAASMITSSVITGAANAFLTLRVGMITRQYCGSLILAEKKTLRRAASAEAAKLLGSIVKKGTARVSKALWKTSKGKVSGVFSDLKESVKETGSSLLTKVGLQKNKEPPGEET
jgi:hypothetical protein